jgi:hypothetical protein
MQSRTPRHACGSQKRKPELALPELDPRRQGTRRIREFPSHRGLNFGQAKLFQGVGDGGGQGLGLIVGRGAGVGAGLGVCLARGVGVGLAVEVGVAVTVVVAVAVGVADGAVPDAVAVGVGLAPPQPPFTKNTQCVSGKPTSPVGVGSVIPQSTALT